MQAAFMTRGSIWDVNLFIDFLKVIGYKWPAKDKEGKPVDFQRTGVLQPVQMWVYAFPEEYKDSVLTTLKFNEEPVRVGKYLQGSWDYGKKSKLALAGLRKMLNVEKVPEFKTDKRFGIPVDNMKNIAITPIGVKYDQKDWWDEDNQCYHEKI